MSDEIKTTSGTSVVVDGSTMPTTTAAHITIPGGPSVGPIEWPPGGSGPMIPGVGTGAPLIGPGAPLIGPGVPFPGYTPAPAPAPAIEPDLDILVVNPDDLKDKVIFICTGNTDPTHLRNLAGMMRAFGERHGVRDVVVIPDARIRFLGKEAVEKLGDTFIDELKKL